MQYIKKFSEAKKIFLVFLIWRTTLFIIAYLAVIAISKWGGRFPYADRELIITRLPTWIWGFGNFDGVHYLRIAQNGYNFLASQAFFPLYPLAIRLFSLILPKNLLLDAQVFVDPAYFYSGIILSNVFFVLGLYFFYKLVKLDFGGNTAFKSLIILLIFPTAFFFGSIYTESLFLCLAASSIYFLRRGKYFVSGILALFASATRLNGLFLYFLILFELFVRFKNKKFKLDYSSFVNGLTTIVLPPLGFIFYLIFLNVKFGNPFLFLTSPAVFGTGRSTLPIVTFPQVVFRYLKILGSVSLSSMSFYISLFELIIALTMIVLLIYSYNKMRLSYWIFTVIAFIVPTMTGTFTSLPRYVLSGFLLIPIIAVNFNNYLKWIIPIFIMLQIILFSLFIRGYWVA